VLNRFSVSLDDNCTTDPSGNTAPVADFTHTTAELEVTFTDQSSDPDVDGSVVAWAWNFGDGNTSTAQNPAHAYGATGDYTVTLTVTDNEGASDSVAQSVSVAEAGAISLSATGYKVKGLKKVDITWSGATSASVDIWRDGDFITSTSNDGVYTDPINSWGDGSYTYQVCEVGTSTCSSEVVVVF